MQNHYRGKREPRKGEMEEISHSRRISKLKVQRKNSTKKNWLFPSPYPVTYSESVSQAHNSRLDWTKF
jgi:hypothetical protein